MTQILSEIYKLVRTGSSSELDPFHVYEGKSCEFAKRPIQAREESLVVYGPYETKSFEVVLLKPLETGSSEAYRYLYPLLHRNQIRSLIFRDLFCSSPARSS